MENGPFIIDVLPIKMEIFNSYVSLPEGIPNIWENDKCFTSIPLPLGEAHWAPAGPAPTISTDSCSPRLGASKGSARGPGRRHGAAPVEGATKLGKQLIPGELAKHGLFYGILWETPLKHDGTSWGLILQGGAPKIAKLVYNSNNYGLWYL